MGNLRSVQKALELIGQEASMVHDPDEIRNAQKLILPGVGAFGAAMENLQEMEVADAIRDFARSGKPFLGICLGMQLLLSESDEMGLYKGLDLIPGRVVKFFKPEDENAQTAGLKIPQIGWNTIKKTSNCPLFEGITDNASVYFVHSYYADTKDDVIAATAEYGINYCAAIWKDNIFATQFHPEKSGAVGLRMLANFAAIK